jgi:hypothetical protein
MREFTLEERIQRVWDKEAVRSVLCRNAYYQAADQRQQALDELWVKEADNAATASYGMNWGYYVGMDEVRRYYVENDPFGGVGSAICHPVCTIRVMVAEDGQTAQAMWYEIAYETRVEDGTPHSLWVASKVAADLVKEKDGWKIWHYFVGLDMAAQPGGAFEKIPVDHSDEEARLQADFGQPTLPMEAYINRYNYYSYPSIPEPYESFDQVVSCGPEGNPKYQA